MTVFLRQRPGWQFPRVVRGEDAVLWDDRGRRFVDAAGGAIVVNVGYGIGEIADAIAEQARRLAYVHATDLVMLGPPLAIEREQVDEAVAILGDAIIAITRGR